MSAYLTALAVTLLGWWISTGVILWLNHLPRRTYPLSITAATLLMGASLACLPLVAASTGTAAAFAGFALALLVWGWLEMTYLMGVLTGPRKSPCPPGAAPGTRFRLALATSIYHETAVVLLGATLLALTWEAPNQVATQSYICLWLMRWSAKLNLFLGVRNYNSQWLPAQLHYLDSYICTGTVNRLFPLSMLLGTVAAAGFYLAAVGSGTLFGITSHSLVASLITLAVIEHLFLMLPLGDAALWRWALPGAGSRRGG